MSFEKEITRLKKNIHISRAINNLDLKSKGLENILVMFAAKYSEEDVKKACKELYFYNRAIPDIQSLIAAYTVKSFKIKANKKNRI